MSERKEWVKPFETTAGDQPENGAPDHPSPRILAAEGDERFDEFVSHNTYQEVPVSETGPKSATQSHAKPLTWLLMATCFLVLTLLGLNGYFTLTDYYGRGWLPGVIVTIPMVAVGMTLLWFCGREIRAYFSLRDVGHLRRQAAHLLEMQDQGRALAFTHRIARLYRRDHAFQVRFQNFLEGYSDTHTSTEVLALFSRDVLRPLDEQVYRTITRIAIQSATLTAVSSLASMDMLLTLWRNARMLREVAGIYGLRPGFSRNLALARHALEALAVSGAGEVVSDMMAENLGNHVVGALSARLGDGLSNGLMTARLGLIIAAECRPMPFNAEDRHGFRQLRANILRAMREATGRAMKDGEGQSRPR